MSDAEFSMDEVLDLVDAYKEQLATVTAERDKLKHQNEELDKENENLFSEVKHFGELAFEDLGNDVVTSWKDKYHTVTARLDAAVALLGELKIEYFDVYVPCLFCGRQLDEGFHDPDCLTVRIRALLEGVKGCL